VCKNCNFSRDSDTRRAERRTREQYKLSNISRKKNMTAAAAAAAAAANPELHFRTISTLWEAIPRDSTSKDAE